MAVSFKGHGRNQTPPGNAGPTMGRTGHALSLAAAVLVLAGTAHAAPLNLAWDQCLSEGGISHKYFACDTNARSEVLVASFVPQAAMADFTGLTAVIDGQTGGYANLPDWWQLFNAGACRQNALTCSVDFLASPNTACTDLWQGSGVSGVGAYYTSLYPPPSAFMSAYALEIRVLAALPGAVPISAGTEYYGFRLTISNAKTKGTGACAGCVAGLCLSLNVMDLYRQSGSSVELLPDHGTVGNFYVGTSVATWECAEGQVSYSGHGPLDFTCNLVGNCAVAARNRTWGSIKALYR